MNLKIAIVMPHFEINSENEDLRWEKIEREILICNLLNKKNNVEAKLFLPKRNEDISPPNWIKLDPKKVYLYKINNSNPKTTDNEKSQDLLNKMGEFSPKIIILKPLGYRFHLWLISKFIKSEIILISGGLKKDNGILKYTKLFLCESQKQIKALSNKKIKTKILMKSVNTNINLETNINKKYDFVCIGRLNKNKNISSIMELGKLFKGLIIGTGPEYKNLKNRILNENLNIEMKGELSKKETLNHLKNSYILLHPSLSEGIPRVFAEAEVYGVPIIAFKGSTLAAKTEYENFIELERDTNLKKEFKIIHTSIKNKLDSENKKFDFEKSIIKYKNMYKKNINDVVDLIINNKDSTKTILYLRFIEVNLRLFFNKVKLLNSILRKIYYEIK